MKYRIVEWCLNEKPYKSREILRFFGFHPKRLVSPRGDCLVVADASKKLIWIFKYGPCQLRVKCQGKNGEIDLGRTIKAANIIKSCNPTDICDGLLMKHPVALRIRDFKWI